MNKNIIFFILGRLLIIEGAFLLISAGVSAIYGEQDYIYFLEVALLNFIIGSISWFSASWPDYPRRF